MLLVAVYVVLRSLNVSLNVALSLESFSNLILSLICFFQFQTIFFDEVIRIGQIVFSGVCYVRSLPNFFEATLLNSYFYLMKVLEIILALCNQA
jgi:hypothetical protein